jgi:hypothetical protein
MDHGVSPLVKKCTGMIPKAPPGGNARRRVVPYFKTTGTRA